MCSQPSFFFDPFCMQSTTSKKLYHLRQFATPAQAMQGQKVASHTRTAQPDLTSTPLGNNDRSSIRVSDII
uniref:Uncharacterized protein n=1 Tax=Oryza brachyantha TaxID=4533 RepID=J3LIE9_ORYBR